MALRHIQQRGACGIEELTETLDVSRVTVHRILDELESQGVVRKERGGVRLVESDPVGGSFARRKSIDLALKKDIATKALDLVSDGDAIFVDASTTAYCLVEALCEQRRSYLLTIVTTSPAVVWHLMDVSEFHVMSTGGELDHRLTSLGGPRTLQCIEDLHFNKAFISPNAINLDGIMTSHSANAAVIQKVLSKGVDTTMLAETPKFGRIAPLRIAPLSSLNRVLTDSALPAATRSAYKKTGLDVR